MEITIVTSLLLDSVSTCSRKHVKPSLLLAGINQDISVNNKLKHVLHLYFQFLLEFHNSYEEDMVDNIIRLANLLD